MKPIGHVTFFKHHGHSVALTASIASSNVTKTKNKDSTASPTSVKNTYNEASGKIAALNEPHENEHYIDVMSID